MSAFDAFFNKGFFRASKCKTLLKLTIPRIKLLRNRRELQIKQMRKEIAKLLETGQEATARIRVEHIIREENMMAAQEILELFCELITVRLPIIEIQRECPLDLKEAISTICFAAPRCADLPELLQVQMQFAAKYGKEFANAASELLPDSGVNRQIIELLSIRAPPVEAKIKLLKEIAEEHNVDWDPTASELELLKPHEDLLNGPSAFIGKPTLLPLPEEKYREPSPSPAKAVHEEPEDDKVIAFDFPEVPKASVRATPVAGVGQGNISVTLSDLECVSPFAMPPSDVSSTPENMNSTPDSVPHPVELPHMPPSFTIDMKDQPKQFKPPVESPHVTITMLSIPSPSPAPSRLPGEKTETQLDYDLGVAVAAVQIAGESAEHAGTQFPRPSQPQTVSPTTLKVTPIAETTDDDLKDVITAAHAAAETAERAAAAARAAASLAEVRITELNMNRNLRMLERTGIEDVMNNLNRTRSAGNQSEKHHSSEFFSPPSLLDELPPAELDPQYASNHQPDHQPLRSPSLEDDPYFSYPNLFSRQSSDLQSVRDGSS